MRELQQYLDQVDSDRLMMHVHTISALERTPGTQEEQQAFAYIADELVSCGLQPVRYEQSAYISIPVSAEFMLGGEVYPCSTHSMLPSADLQAELVFVDSLGVLEKNDYSGKIVVMESLAMAPVMLAAEKAGAAGMLFIAGSRQRHEMIVSRVWGSPEPKDCDAYITIPAVTVCHADGQRIREQVRQGISTAHIRTAVQTGWMDLPLITADIGPMEKGYVLLTGHVDSWHKGAMDNASGNAAALEIARIFAAQQEGMCRGLRVVFWSGHSHGRYAGSAAFCDAFFQDLYDAAMLHINVDCLGACGSTVLTQAACMPETYGLGNYAIQTVTGETLEGSRFSRSCDQSFWGTGTPSLFSSVSEQPKPLTPDAASKAFAIMFGGSQSGGYGWWWHTEGDTADKLDPVFLQRDTKIFLAAVFAACTEKVIPLDIRAAVGSFAAIVRAYAARASAELDCSMLLNELQCLENLLERVDFSICDAETANTFLLRFEQRFVPLVYVKSSIYGHDPAAAQGPVPLLEEMASLAVGKDTHTKNSTKILARRRINHVVHVLRELIDMVNGFLQQSK